MLHVCDMIVMESCMMVMRTECSILNRVTLISFKLKFNIKLQSYSPTLLSHASQL